MTAANAILDRLSRVTRTKPGQWMAACPICESKKGRPLAVTEAGDRVLMHAFCGCSTEDVLGRIGLTVNDLFDKPLAHRQEPARASVSARDLLTVISEEASVIAVIAAQVVDKREMSEADWDRLATAASRVFNARDHIR